MKTFAGAARNIAATALLLAVPWSVVYAADGEEQPPKEEALPQATLPAASPAAPVEDKRMFGVLANYRTADGSQPFVPLTAQRKLYIGYKDSTDYPIFATTALFVGISNIQGRSASFGGGLSGFAKSYGANYTGQGVGNFMTEAVFPVLLREDPRYFRRGTGSTGSRLRYALTRVFVTRTDAGNARFNGSELLGNVMAASLSNIYAQNTRTYHAFGQSLALQYATDSLSAALKEFWPDLKRRWRQRHP